MTKENTQNNVIALAVVGNSVADITTGLFKDIDFSGISNAIENIAKYNQNMTIEEKEMATDIVGKWEKDVISRLREKGQEFSNFVFFIESVGSVAGESLFEEIGEELAAQTKSQKEYDALVKAIDDLEVHYQTRPIEPIEREDRTYAERLQEDQTYRVEKAKYEINVKRLQREVYLKEYEWKKLVKQDKQVKELLKKAKRFQKDMGKFTGLCHDKAQLAKLNIAVSNAGIRDSLRDLLNFSATI